jgi:hypothetical protein
MMANETRVLKIEPEDVDVIGIFDFKIAYHSWVKEWGVSRLGERPEFTFTVRPGYAIQVKGYTV